VRRGRLRCLMTDNLPFLCNAITTVAIFVGLPRLFDDPRIPEDNFVLGLGPRNIQLSLDVSYRSIHLPSDNQTNKDRISVSIRSASLGAIIKSCETLSVIRPKPIMPFSPKSRQIFHCKIYRTSWTSHAPK
jgi:hypothetical protein